MTVKSNRLSQDPAKDISVPSLKKTLPKYLSLEESIELLKNIQSDFYERDFCIVTLFLNCGMRLVELVGIDLKDFQNDTIRIVGKGNKERLVYPVSYTHLRGSPPLLRTTTFPLKRS